MYTWLNNIILRLLCTLHKRRLKFWCWKKRLNRELADVEIETHRSTRQRIKRAADEQQLQTNISNKGSPAHTTPP